MRCINHNGCLDFTDNINVIPLLNCIALHEKIICNNYVGLETINGMLLTLLYSKKCM